MNNTVPPKGKEIIRKASSLLHKKPLIAARYLGIGALTLAFATCTAIPVDYSAYSNVNLIPNGQFAANTGNPSLGWSTDEQPVTGVNMWYQEVVSTAGANSSGDTYAGYGSIILQTDLTAATGIANLPIYRLETINLFQNGDGESGTFGSSVYNGGSANATNAMGAYPTRPYYDMTGYRLDVSDSSNSSFYFNISSYPGFVSGASYALGFKFKLTGSSSGGNTENWFSTDNSTNNYFVNAGQALNNKVPYYAEYPGTLYRFPFTISSASKIIGSSLLTTNANLQYLWFNTTNVDNGIGKATEGDFDDFQLVRSDLANALRIDIPWTAAGRPTLQTGGHYTVKLWVRQDKTSNYAGGSSTLLNRFDADFIVISLHSAIGSTTAVGNVPNTMTVYSIGSASDWISAAAANGWTNLASIANWTQISASFSGPQSPIAGLQLAISTTNMASATLRSPGSILIANPQVFWSPY